MTGMELHAFCNQSRVSDLFHGQSKTTLIYACGKSEQIDEVLAFWELPLPAIHGVINLHDCIDLWRQGEQLIDDNRIYCDDCKKLENAFRQIGVWKFAPVLIIHLRRFRESKGHIVKNDVIVEYPLEFQSSDYSESTDRIDRGDEGVYDLIAVVCHSGTLHFGHYVSIVRDCNAIDEWYLMNDSEVSKVDNSRVQNDNAYVLIYQQRG
jgi:ubiquitin C-terminal hydrolase